MADLTPAVSSPPLDLSKAPRCAAYMRALKAKADEPGMNAYWAALCIAESFTEADLEKFGGICFHTMDGPALLARMEEFLQARATGLIEAKGGKIPFKPAPKRNLEEEATRLIKEAEKSNLASKKIRPAKGPIDSPLDKITAAVSPEEIEKKSTGIHGFSRKLLAEWGVPWPPPKGWKDKLISNYRASAG